MLAMPPLGHHWAGSHFPALELLAAGAFAAGRSLLEGAACLWGGKKARPRVRYSVSSHTDAALNCMAENIYHLGDPRSPTSSISQLCL